jgi:hypothetical protein
MPFSTFREDEQAYLNPTHASWNQLTIVFVYPAAESLCGLHLFFF